MSKKILSLLLAAVMVFSLGVTAFAADVQYPVIKGDYTHCPGLRRKRVTGLRVQRCVFHPHRIPV